MNVISWIILSTFILSIISLVGILTLIIRDKWFNKILILFVGLSAGALLGGAFLHLIPESMKVLDVSLVFIYVLVGFSLFFIIEKVLHWRHCHKGDCKIHSFAYMNLVGETIHNFLDGLIIAGSYIVSIPLGITTTLAISLHEIPQEIGDFGVLVKGGFSKKKALGVNFLVALFSIFGGIIGYFLGNYSTFLMNFILPFAAGGFLYIGASDLIPEVRKEEKLSRFFLTFVAFLIGIGFMILTL